jgi:yeast amino acid transporter
MSEDKTRDTIDSAGDNGKKDDLGDVNGDSSLPGYRVPSNVVETAKPKQSYPTRILHSFRRREETVRLNNLGQMVVDPEKYPASVTSETGNDTSRLDRKLKGRHMQMIAIGGAIGTGLFIGSGSSLATGGPLALLLGFGIVGIMLFCVIHALGELAVVFPIAGISFI